jgi:hypothetical protein
MSAAHKITARGYRVIGRGYSAPVFGAGPARNARKSTPNARVHPLARRMHFAAASRVQVFTLGMPGCPPRGGVD